MKELWGPVEIGGLPTIFKLDRACDELDNLLPWAKLQCTTPSYFLEQKFSTGAHTGLSGGWREVRQAI